MANQVIMADRTLFGSVCRIDIDNPASVSGSLVVNKSLQLPESPLMNPFIVFSGFPDVAQIFHHNYRWNTTDDSLAYVMVSPCHEPLPSSREFSKMSLGRFSAFGLEFANQFIVLNPKCFDVFSEEFSIRSDSKIVYSDINTENNLLRSTVNGVDVFRESEDKETFTLLVNPDKAFCDIPREVLLVAIRDSEGELLSAFDSRYAKNISFERRTSWEIVSDGCSIDDWFGLSLLDHTTGLLDASNTELALQTVRFEREISERMQFDVIPYFMFPSSINTELQPFGIEIDSLNKFGRLLNLNFYTDGASHIESKSTNIFKYFGNEETGLIPRLKSWVSALTII